MNQTPYVFNKIVDVRSGEVFERLTTIQTSEVDGKVRMVSWSKGDLRKDGQPDGRARPLNVGVTRRVYHDGVENQVEFRGNLAMYNSEREIEASKLRSVVRQAEEALEAARSALLAVYVTEN